MIIHKLKDMKGGWFIGNFTPSVLKTEKFEVGYHTHKKGDSTHDHYHKRSTEINVITKGKMLVNGEILIKGNIFIFPPYTVSEAKFLEDTELIVIRNSSHPKDKFII